MNESVYRSEIDDWLLVVFRSISVVSAVAAVLLLCFELSASSLVMIPILAVGVVLPWWLLATTRYTLTDRELAVRCGPFRRQIALRHITSIKATMSSESSPALSTDRLRIEHSDGSALMVSPERRNQFLQELRARGVAV